MQNIKIDKPRRVPGLRYETCAECGLEWNVSMCCEDKRYVCPWCRAKGRFAIAKKQITEKGGENNGSFGK